MSGGEEKKSENLISSYIPFCTKILFLFNLYIFFFYTLKKKKGTVLCKKKVIRVENRDIFKYI